MKINLLRSFNAIVCICFFFVCTSFSSNNSKEVSIKAGKNKPTASFSVSITVGNAVNASLQVEFVPSNYTLIVNSGTYFHGAAPLSAGTYTITIFQTGSHTYSTSGGKVGSFTNSATFTDYVDNAWVLSVH